MNGFRWRKLSGAACTKLLSLVASLAILSFASSAMALLRQGDQGPEVTDLQNRLTAAGCYNGPVTGVFEELTREAVIRCQQENGLEADGIAGPATFAVLPGGNTTETNVSSASSSDAYGDGVSTTSGGIGGGTLRQGDSGQAVSDLQQRLSALGYYYGPIDGSFGQQTEDAVVRFQNDRGLTPDGIVGDEVLQALNTTSSSTESTNTDSTSPPPTITSTTTDQAGLRIGDQGTQVEDLQRRLKTLGYFDASVTGYYGTVTRDAVIRFQQARGLPVTGVADTNTLNSLNSATAGDDDSSNRYVVVVPKQDEATLFRVRQFVPAAVLEKSRLGEYIQAGRFSTLAAASSQTKLLRAQGLDARVNYQ